MQEYVVICEWVIERVTFPGHWQGKVEVLARKPAPVPIYPPQTLYRLAWNQTQEFTVRNQRLPPFCLEFTDILRLPFEMAKILHRLQSVSVG